MADRGRPRTFDRTAALHRAMEVFWQQGYEGASMTDLTSAMGINSPSLYAAFGSKEQLFREAVAHYNDTDGAEMSALLRDGPTARDAIAAALRHNAVAFADPATPRGCMIVLTATTSSERNRTVHDYLVDWRARSEVEFRDRVERGIADGDVPADADAATIAAFYNAVNQGMAIQARDGVDSPRLMAVADAAIAAWDALLASPPPPPATAGAGPDCPVARPAAATASRTPPGSPRRTG
jgi:AcrR family transcriptional regulator